ncbi:hypothetical protein DIPPA_28458 [Diplonema papillatum]|nr:hypothetical protein DIPPA_28458 [Diplonema papillatum]
MAEVSKHDFSQPLCAVENGEKVYSRDIALKILAERGLTSGSTAQMLCVHTLMRGCVNAFVELHRLSRRPPICVNELAGDMFSLSEDRLPWVTEMLTEAEELKRKSRFSEVYDRYVTLADFFEAGGDYATTVDFHNMGLKCARLGTDKALECRAHEMLGLVHERRGVLPEAAKCFEAFLRISEAARAPDQKRRANCNLIRVYSAIAAEREQTGRYEDARDHYSKAVHTAAANGDHDAEGEAYSKLGSITVLLGDLQKALEYQKRFLLVSKQMRSERKEGRAVRECASLQEKLEHREDAVASLKRALEIAEEQHDLSAIADTCKQLGSLYTALDEHAKAVHCHKECYRVAKVLNDPAKVQEARIQVGMAEGNLRWLTASGTGYVGMVSSDIQSLLAWKSKGTI